MRLAALLLASACAVVPAPALAQSPDLAAPQEQLAAMRSEIARLTERVADLQAAEQARETTPASASAPETEVEWKGAPELTHKESWSFKPRGRVQVDAGVVYAPDSTGRSDGFG